MLLQTRVEVFGGEGVEVLADRDNDTLRHIFFDRSLTHSSLPPPRRARVPLASRCERTHLVLETQRDPSHVKAEAELTEEHMEMGERGAKEMMYDRRRSQLDVYLVCAAYRANRKAAGVWAAEPALQLCEEDSRLLDELLSQAALI